MIEFFSQTAQWWGVLFILGACFFPLTKTFFSSFLDRGYIFSKIIAIILVSYTAFVLGTLHIAPFTLPTLIAVFVVGEGINLFFLKRLSLREHRLSIPLIIFEEILFTLCLFFWAYVRSTQPDIHGLEKFMDYGFVNSILRSIYFPPRDMWMTPLSINYYYFGHLCTAVLTKLSLLPSSSTFNLMIATIFALTVTGGFSIGGNLWTLYHSFEIGNLKLKIGNFVSSGLLAAFLLAGAGNLHTLYTFFTPYQNDNPVPPWQLVFSPSTFPNSYWYPNATRFIYHTIHEFPLYSFVVSDLHGHVLDIPFVLLTLAFLLTFFTKPFQRNFQQLVTQAILFGSMCAIMYMTNAWDGLIYLFVTTILYLVVLSEGKVFSLLDAIFTKKFLVFIVSLLASFIVISLPFSLFFKPFASQVGLNCAPQFLLSLGHIGPLIFENGYCQQSPWWQLLILYGFFLFWILSFVLLLFKKSESKQLAPVDAFGLLLGVVGLLLIIVPEFFYLKDIYTTYFRANTMFKLVYQAFILLSLASGYSIMRVYTSLRFQKHLVHKFLSVGYLLIGAILLSMVAIYPYFAITSYYNNLKHFQGLNGTTYLTTLSKSDASGIAWLNTHVVRQPVILEAQGDSYTDYARVSSNTGLPTVFGWTVHEWLWRNSYDVAPPRIADVKTLYESTSLNQTKKLVQKYHISYVFLGSLERSKYLVDEEKWRQLGNVVFHNGDTVIYRLK